ncbi:hypothetical protein ACW2AB_04540 [Limosilactobacillus fermentum]
MNQASLDNEMKYDLLDLVEDFRAREGPSSLSPMIGTLLATMGPVTYT